jgi:hypothetical protein
MPLTATMAVLRLTGTSLIVYSPVRLKPEWLAAVEAVGRVEHLYAPNLMHHRRVGEWASLFASARVHAPRGLDRKRPALRIDRVIDGAGDPGFAGAVDEVVIDGFRLNEGVLFHRSTRTLVVADLVHNIGRPAHPWTRCYAGLMGFYGRVALSRMIQWTGFPDRPSARRSLERVLALPFERVIVGHGLPVTGDARRAVARAYDWLLDPR